MRTTYREVTEPTLVDIVGKGPIVIDSGFLVTTERPERFDWVAEKPKPKRPPAPDRKTAVKKAAPATRGSSLIKTKDDSK